MLLALVMAASLLPAVSQPAAAKQTPSDPSQAPDLDHTDVISLPITIRNHAADGMLFEWDGIGDGDYQFIHVCLPQLPR